MKCLNVAKSVQKFDIPAFVSVLAFVEGPSVDAFLVHSQSFAAMLDFDYHIRFCATNAVSSG